MVIIRCNFNSIKVRLKRPPGRAVRTLCAFQFHKGTIKTYISLSRVVNLSGFQFHKGTIKTDTFRRCKSWNIYFNSIKVRLKRRCVLYGWLRPSFQFHKGTIKTSKPGRRDQAVEDFNSIKVRLKRVILTSCVISYIISIP